MSHTAIKDKVMIDGRDPQADSTPMWRLGNEYHRRERRPRDHRHPCRVKQRLSAHEETSAGKERRGACKDRRSHDDTVHRKHQKHHHRQWKRVCLPQAHRTTSQNKGLFRTPCSSSSRYNCERLSALPPVQRARSSSIKDILYVMNVMGKGAYTGNYGLNTGNISFEACVASWKIRTVVGTKSPGLQR